jgi:hypothetical protein
MIACVFPLYAQYVVFGQLRCKTNFVRTNAGVAACGLEHRTHCSLAVTSPGYIFSYMIDSLLHSSPLRVRNHHGQG